ncbi:HGGxSTG domain-containing protein [Rhodospirillaceae bacterium SYSU D60014]|uniref:HGGxSTG domain-containing protein n=1 Tax=Virgifigura deserti TaxID=2268457 RepID=UPI000E66201B
MTNNQDQQLAKTKAYLEGQVIEAFRIEAFVARWQAGKHAKAWRVVRHPVCGAKRKKGGRCLMRPAAENGRCKYHGGLSTGARTAEGRARIAEAQRRRWLRWRAECDAIDPFS